jgi:hypothetical protein
MSAGGYIYAIEGADTPRGASRGSVATEDYTEILQTLGHIIAHQRERNRQPLAMTTDTTTTLARVETVAVRMLRHDDNGHEG